MAIVKMKKLQLMVVRAQKDALLRELTLLGCVEVTEPDAFFADEEAAACLRRESGSAVETRAELNRLLAALRLLDKYAPVKSKLLQARPMVSEAEFLDEDALRAQLAAAQQLEALEAQVRRLAGEESKLRSTAEALRPWAPLELPLDMTGTASTAVAFGTLPATASFDAACRALADAAPEAALFEVSSDKEQRYTVLVSLREEQAEAVAALRALGYAFATVTGLHGTAQENIDGCARELSGVTQQREAAEKQIASYAVHRDAFKLSIDRMTVQLGRAEAAERLVGTESVVCMRGWLTAPEEEKLTQALAKFDCAWELSDPVEEEYESVPVQLRNNKVTEALNMVTNMYSLPAYGTVDPNPLMTPFFVLFYGVMMADMGYGLLMTIAALVVMKSIRPKRGTKYFCKILLECGISTFVLGIFTGGFFGNAIPAVVGVIAGHEVSLGLLSQGLIDPLKDTTTVLVGAMVLGFIQLVTGMVVSFVQKTKAGDLAGAVFEEGTWWVIFIGIALCVLKIGNVGKWPVPLCIGILMLLYGSGRGAKGIGKLTAFVSAVYSGVTGWFGDILSYSRLMALMLAGSVIAQVFNTLAVMPAQGGVTVISVLFFIVIFLLGHALNFGLNLLGCFVHDLRLQCLEFFGKFYTDGGKPFRPLEINTKYVDVENHDF